MSTQNANFAGVVKCRRAKRKHSAKAFDLVLTFGKKRADLRHLSVFCGKCLHGIELPAQLVKQVSKEGLH